MALSIQKGKLKMKRKGNYIAKIQEIENFLKDKKINLKIKYYKNDFFYVCYIYSIDNFDIAIIGKGENKNKALLCAYAELFERLYSKVLIGKKIMNKTIIQNINQNNCFEIQKDNLQYEFYEYIDSNKNLIQKERFINLLDNNFIDLPLELIENVCQTNGLAVGNTLNEAILAAMYEIIERYVYKYYFTKEHKIKVLKIPDSFKNTKLYKKIIKSNIEIRLLDLTMNSLLPAVGVLLIKEKKYNFFIGVDYNINDAILSALKDMDQHDVKNYICVKSIENDIINSLCSISNESLYYNLFLNRINNSGKIPKYFFECSQKENQNLIFQEDEISNFDSIEKIKRIFKNIYYYVYNNQILYCVRVYIPHVTEINDLSKSEMKFYSNFNKINNIFYNLNEASKDDINFLIEKLFLLISFQKYKYIITVSELFKYRKKDKISKMTVANFLIYLILNYNRIYLLKIKEYLTDDENKRLSILENKKVKKYKIQNCNESSCLKCKYKKCEFRKGKKVWTKITT